MDQQLDQILRANLAAVGLLADISTRIGDLAKAMKGTGKGAGASGTKDAAKGIGGQIAGFVKSIGKVVAVVSAVVAAFLAIPAAIAGMVFAAIPFVKALSPAAVELFNQALDDLQATIGSALLPIITEATQSLRVMAGAILPLMNQLRPVIAKLSAALTSLASGAIRYLVAVLQVLLTAAEPLIDMFSGLIEAFGQYFDVLATVVQVLGTFGDVIEAIQLIMSGPLLGAYQLLTGETANLKSLFAELAKATAFAVTGLLKLVGANSVIAKFKEQLKKNIDARKNPTGGLKAAPGDSAITGAEDIAKKFTEAAFKATAGGTPARSETDIMEDILKAVELGETTDLAKVIEDGVFNAMKRLPGAETVRGGASAVRSVFDTSATGEDRAAAARAAGGGWAGAAAARGAGIAVDVADTLTFGAFRS